VYEPKPLNYAELNVDPPTVDLHEKPELIKPRGNWKQKGNYIYREAEGLNYGSQIPPTHILIGTDDKGLPILEKIKL
jgi:hypothetical protein